MLGNVVFSEGHFMLGVKTKEIQELSNPIGGELKIGPKCIANVAQ
jgi:hypothetical protein